MIVTGTRVPGPPFPNPRQVVFTRRRAPRRGTELQMMAFSLQDSKESTRGERDKRRRAGRHVHTVTSRIRRILEMDHNARPFSHGAFHLSDGNPGSDGMPTLVMTT